MTSSHLLQAAVSVAAITLLAIVLWHTTDPVEPDSFPRTLRPEDAAIAAVLRKHHEDGVALLRRLDEAIAAEGHPPETLFLEPLPSIPANLLGDEERATYAVSVATLRAWLATVPEGEDLVHSERVDTPEAMALWELCQHHRALRRFVITYRQRERERWAASEPSVSLEAELTPVSTFVARHYGTDPELWRLARAFSDEVQTRLRLDGEQVGSSDDEPASWALLELLSDSATPAFDALFEALKGD